MPPKIDDTTNERDERLIRNLERDIEREKAPKPEREAQEPETDDIEVSLDADDDDDDEAHEEERRPSRDEKKRERKRLLDQLAERDRANAALSERLARHEGAMQVLMQRQQQQAPVRDENELPKPLQDLYEEQVSFSREYNARVATGKMTADEEAGFIKRGQRLELRKHQIMTEESLRAAGIQRQDPREAVFAAARAQFADVYADPKGAGIAQVEYTRRTAVNGEPDGPQTLYASLEHARRELKSGSHRNRPSSDIEADKRRFTAPSRGAGAGAGAERQSNSMVVKKGSPEWQLAMSMSSHQKTWSDAQKVQHWVRKVGSKLAAT